MLRLELECYCVQVNEIVMQQQNMSKELDCILEAYLAINPK
jgi:hypothetical protein